MSQLSAINVPLFWIITFLSPSSFSGFNTVRAQSSLSSSFKFLPKFASILHKWAGIVSSLFLTTLVTQDFLLHLDSLTTVKFTNWFIFPISTSNVVFPKYVNGYCLHILVFPYYLAALHCVMNKTLYHSLHLSLFMYPANIPISPLVSWSWYLAGPAFYYTWLSLTLLLSIFLYSQSIVHHFALWISVLSQHFSNASL